MPYLNLERQIGKGREGGNQKKRTDLKWKGGGDMEEREILSTREIPSLNTDTSRCQDANFPQDSIMSHKK